MPNKLTLQSDIATRDFYRAVVSDPGFLRDSPAHRRQLEAILLEALNYTQLPSGAYVTRSTNVTTRFGSQDYSDYPDEWGPDEEKVRAAIDNQDTSQASTSSKGSDSTVRKAVLSEDL